MADDEDVGWDDDAEDIVTFQIGSAGGVFFNRTRAVSGQQALAKIRAHAEQALHVSRDVQRTTPSGMQGGWSREDAAHVLALLDGPEPEAAIAEWIRTRHRAAE